MVVEIQAVEVTYSTHTPTPLLTRIRFMQNSLIHIFKRYPFNTYYETETPSLTRISLHVVLTNLVNTNYA